MSLDLRPYFREYLDTVKIDIQAQMRAQKRVATGNAITRLRVVENQFLKATLRGVGYMEYLEDGVGSQPSKIGEGFINNLTRWIEAKGITPDDDRTIKQTAFAIANSLIEKGSAIRRGQTGLDYETPIKENAPELLKGIGDEVMLSYTKNLNIGS